MDISGKLDKNFANDSDRDSEFPEIQGRACLLSCPGKGSSDTESERDRYEIVNKVMIGFGIAIGIGVVF